MTPSRYDSLLRDLTVICRKVFDATPIADAWQDGAIMAEMRRKGSNTEFSVIRGCLENLRKLGLVIETAPRTFQRIREPIPKAKPLMPAPTPENTATTHRPAPPAPATSRTRRPCASSPRWIASHGYRWSSARSPTSWTISPSRPTRT